MRYRIYTKTEKAWDAMLSSINKAKSSIFFEMYTFVDNTEDTHDFIKILEKKALLGVNIKIVMDSFGSSEFTANSIKKLKDAGVEILFFKTLFRHTHRKILIIDEKVAFVGGINITKFYKKWDDLMIRIEGKVIKYVIKSFVKLYKYCGGKDPLLLKHEKELIYSKGKVWFFENYLLRNSFRLSKYYRDKIDFAKNKILIVTPYFMPNQWLIKSLKNAAKRGVIVEIVMPEKADHPKIANIPNYFYMHKLYKHNIKFLLTKEMVHSKLMLVDDEEGILGSQNIDILSFDLNIESGIFFTDKELIFELKEIAENWKKDATPYSPKMRDTHLLDHFYEFCFGIFEQTVKFWNKFTA